MTLSKIFAVMVALMVTLLSTICTTVAYYLFFEKPYLSYTQLPFRVLSASDAALTASQRPVRHEPASFAVGEPINMVVLRCNADNKTRVYELSPVLKPEDPAGRAILLRAVGAPIAPGCSDSIRAVSIPIVPPGKYHLEGLAEVNGTIRTFFVGWSSEVFNVVAP